MKQAWETMMALKLVWFRTACYFLLPAITYWLGQTETWSGETWEHTHPFLKYRLLISSIVQGTIPLIAFIDQSLHRARDKINGQREQKD